MYSIVYNEESDKYLSKITGKSAQRVISKLESVAKDPFASHPNSTKMQDLKNGYRLRVGDLRVIYEINSLDKTIHIWKIQPRGSVYK